MSLFSVFFVLLPMAIETERRKPYRSVVAGVGRGSSSIQTLSQGIQFDLDPMATIVQFVLGHHGMGCPEVEEVLCVVF